MTIFLYELKRNKLALIIWCAALSVLLAMTAMLFPILVEEMKEMKEMLESLGDLSGALGLDQMMSGDFLSYFAGEYTDTVALGGGIYAALIAIAALAGEENNHTAEFLLTHPVSRNRVLLEKGLSVLVRLFILNFAVGLVSVLSALVIRAEFDQTKLLLLILASFILEVEIAAICFMLSAFALKGGTGIALGVTLGGYFINLFALASEEVEWLKYLTPFSYASGAYINENGAIELPYLLIGLGITAVSIVIAYLYYNKKDIR